VDREDRNCDEGLLALEAAVVHFMMPLFPRPPSKTSSASLHALAPPGTTGGGLTPPAVLGAWRSASGSGLLSSSSMFCGIHRIEE